MVSRTKYRQLEDLYVEGTEVELKDGLVIWLQTLNPFQLDDARSQAQAARARLVMALEEGDSDEAAKVAASWLRSGRDKAIEQLLDEQTNDFLLQTVESIRNDPEWTERLDIADRSDELMAREPEDAERQLVEKINSDYLTEVNRRIDDEREIRRQEYSKLDDEALRDVYREVYIARRGNEVALAEHRLLEIWHAARVCEGEKGDDGTWNHRDCENHRMRVWETKADVREIPRELHGLLTDRMSELNMSAREAKGLGRPGSSAVSSAPQNVEAESTPSTQDETPEPALGTSPSPSTTP